MASGDTGNFPSYPISHRVFARDIASPADSGSDRILPVFPIRLHPIIPVSYRGFSFGRTPAGETDRGRQRGDRQEALAWTLPV